MARPDTAKTSFLGLPLRLTGIVQISNSIRNAFQAIDAFAQSVQTGSGIEAHNINYATDDSNSSQADRSVGAELDAIRARLAVLEGKTNSNSQG